jgi:hypothetical protein
LRARWNRSRDDSQKQCRGERDVYRSIRYATQRKSASALLILNGMILHEIAQDQGLFSCMT